MRCSPDVRFAAAVLATIAFIAGCSLPSPTAPAGPVQREVRVRVTDAGGASVAHSLVYAIDESGATTQLTDTSGTARFTLASGAWTVYTSTPAPGLVAASTAVVPSQGGPDTVLFRLQLVHESIATGQVLLSGRTDHRLTAVAVFQLPVSTQTLPDGSWRLDGLPPGDWQGFASHTGFQTATFPLHVRAPADTLSLDKDPITLLPVPTP